jgi:hypothetical protein
MTSNTKFFAKVLVSIFAFGLTWVVSNQAAVITAVTIALLWGLNTLFKSKGINLGRGVVTGALYLIAYVLVIVFNPGILPTWPVFPGDPTLALAALMAYAQLLIVALIPYGGAAMTIYNMLLRDVLDGLVFPLADPE